MSPTVGGGHVRAGELRHYVTIQDLTEAGTSTGGKTETWTDFAKLWASIEPLTGTEFFEGAALERETNVRITTRWIPNVTKTMRIVDGATIYDIQSIANIDERNRQLEIMAVRS